MVSSNDVQRLFLQAVFSRRILSQKLASKIWEKCIDAVRSMRFGRSSLVCSRLICRRVPSIAANESLDIEYKDDRASWDTFVTNINDALNPLDLEFARLHDEVNGKEMYAVVRPVNNCYRSGKPMVCFCVGAGQSKGRRDRADGYGVYRIGDCILQGSGASSSRLPRLELCSTGVLARSSRSCSPPMSPFVFPPWPHFERSAPSSRACLSRRRKPPWAALWPGDGW